MNKGTCKYCLSVCSVSLSSFELRKGPEIIFYLLSLGIVCMSNGSFCKNIYKLVNQSRKALYHIEEK